MPPTAAALLCRFYAPGPSLLPSVQARLYRQSILQDTLERKLYKARDIEGLFRCAARWWGGGLMGWRAS
jgi:hypothetical protein